MVLKAGCSRLVLLTFFVALGCGGPDPVEPLPYPGHNNNGSVTDGDADGEDDSDGDEDTDGDGDGDDPGPVDGAGDNCPHISNPDQADRDRDGVGDACDHFPYLYDPDNPEEVEILLESEGGPNSDFLDAREHWLLELPFIVEGELSTNGEMDHYAIRVEEATNVLVHLEALHSSVWPAVVFVGDSETNDGHQIAVLADNAGLDVVHDVHLPLPGRYIVVFSDFRTLSNQGNIGGAGYGYRMSLSAPPLPDGEYVTLPTPRKVVPYEREPLVFTVDVEGKDALRVRATGAPHNQNSVLYAAIHLLDSKSGAMLGFTLQEQIPENSLRNELNIKLGEHLTEVDVVVHSHLSLGANDVLIEIEAREIAQDLETFENPRDSRGDVLLWMTPGTEVEAVIGPPKVTSDTTLQADEDFFLIYAQPGQLLEVEVEPLANSLMIPELSFGVIWFYPTFEFFSAFHRSRGAAQRGDTGRMSLLVTADRQGELVTSVHHQGNAWATAPVGGPQYGYQLRVRERERAGGYAAETFPATVPIVLEAGEQGIYDFPFVAGNMYRITYNGGWARPLQLIDTESWEVLESSTSSMSFIPGEGRGYLLATRETNGQRTLPSQNITLLIEEIPVSASTVTAPHVEHGAVEAGSYGSWWRVQLEPDTLYAVNVVGENEFGGPLEINVFDVDTLSPVVAARQGFITFESGNRDEVLVSIADPAGVASAALSYGVSIAAVEPVAFAQSVEIEAGVRPVFLTRGQPTPGLTVVRAQNSEETRMQVEIWSEALQRLSSDRERSWAALARSSPQNYVFAVIPREYREQSYGATLSVETLAAADAQGLLAAEATVENPEEVTAFPALYQGSLSPGLPTRHFSVPLEAGDRIHAYTSAVPGGSLTTIDPDLNVYTPQGWYHVWSWGGGEGNYPVLEDININETGDWIVEIDLWNPSGSGSGQFVLYLLRDE